MYWLFYISVMAGRNHRLVISEKKRGKTRIYLVYLLRRVLSLFLMLLISPFSNCIKEPGAQWNIIKHFKRDAIDAVAGRVSERGIISVTRDQERVGPVLPHLSNLKYLTGNIR